jgi:hypothetical protein
LKLFIKQEITVPDGTDVVRLEHERRVHSPQLAGVWLLGSIGVLAILAILVISIKSSPNSTALSALSTVAAAAVGGIAGMLTGAKQTSTAAEPSRASKEQSIDPKTLREPIAEPGSG